MAYRSMLAMILCCGISALAGVTQYAADLRWDDDVHAYLGFANTTTKKTTVTVTGYAADGSPIGSFQKELAAYARFEAASGSLFEAAVPAWASVSADAILAGYVRYEYSAGDISLAPLSPVAGSETWVGQINQMGDFQTTIALVNTAAAEGTANRAPAFQNEETTGKTEEPIAIPDFGAPFQKIYLGYSSFEKVDSLLWDRIRTQDLALAGNLHLTDVAEGHVGRSSITLPRTPYPELIMGPLHPDSKNYLNSLILINPYPVEVPVDITAYYSYLHGFDFMSNDPLTTRVVLAPYERRQFDVSSLNEELPANASWFRVKPFENGLIGYQLIKAKNGQSAAAIEGGVQPTSWSALPYTPTTADLTTYITLLNPTDERVSTSVIAFDDAGKRVAYAYGPDLYPGEKRVQTVEKLFGAAKAARITWLRSYTNRGQMLSHALVCRRDGTALAAMQGVPHGARDGFIFHADFEQQEFGKLQELEWQPLTFSNPGEYRNAFLLTQLTINGFEFLPGTFFDEQAHGSVSGYFYMGYEPFYRDNFVTLKNGERETVGLMSPWFEVPHYGPWYFSYWLRLHDPDATTGTSRYGMIWRVEGSDEWTWFGINGDIIEHPPLLIRDCYATIQYRNEVVTVFDWQPFQMELPEETYGKRIQVGLFFDFEPFNNANFSPRQFIDEVRIGPRSLDHFWFFPQGGTETLTFDNVQESPPVPNPMLPYQ